MGEGIAVVTLIGISILIFSIYYIYKQLQYVLVSVNLFKKIVNRQDAIIKVLLDIRDNTNEFTSEGKFTSKSVDIDEDDSFICEECNKDVPQNAVVCPHCGAKFE